MISHHETSFYAESTQISCYADVNLDLKLQYELQSALNRKSDYMQSVIDIKPRDRQLSNFRLHTCQLTSKFVATSIFQIWR